MNPQQLKSKIERRSKIIELIQNNNIETQKELTDMLVSLGFDVTQSTVSRDIRELNITKITTPKGKQIYGVIDTKGIDKLSTYIRVFNECVVSIDHAQNILVIKTFEGMAMAVATALDGMNYSEIIGSIAGDDTLFVLVKSKHIAFELVHKLTSIRKT